MKSTKLWSVYVLFAVAALSFIGLTVSAFTEIGTNFTISLMVSFVLSIFGLILWSIIFLGSEPRLARLALAVVLLALVVGLVLAINAR